MLKTAALLVVLAVVGARCAEDYCALCADHTMCKYRSPGPKCTPIIQSGVSAAERGEVLTAHNQLRARVAVGDETKGRTGRQPGAANMRKMVWDDELAKVAQRWADQCDFGHDACRKVKEFSVGQNAYMAGTTGNGNGADWRSAVQAWYDEVKDFDKKSISPFKFSSKIGHYSQVAWAETYKVGCGFTRFPDGAWTQSLYICNYGPAGNMLGDVMYEQGRACSRCPRGSTCEGGLCA